ncbi:peptide-methionine (S)-S-oxide reductase MsrA [Propionibacteriaceae bacterium Y1700]|uniref:peptide-methionine (S)-S-oxide reductase MsrA n=1 Tax=Microlunatus sp. Y1700 TaxID=3418487 RepID=UPI003DA777AF
MFFTRPTPTMVTAAEALPGRTVPVLQHPTFHEVFGTRLDHPPAGSEVAYVAMGCFWGAEKLFWQTEGVTLTAAGYIGGFTPNPTYEETCSGRTGHAEAVRVHFDPTKINYTDLLKIFWENHDPTQGLGQGNDIGSQYRSGIWTVGEEQATLARQSYDDAAQRFAAAGFGELTTSLEVAPEWYFAEDYHQQYLDKNPNGYCPVHATGVTCG